MGVGGIGINAVQGAAHAGAPAIIAVDPVEFKREAALQFGATDAFATIEEAAELARSLTNGQGADSAIVTVGVARRRARRRRRSTPSARPARSSSPPSRQHAPTGIPVNLFELAMFQKRIQGACTG